MNDKKQFLDSLSPYIRNIGVQGSYQWKTRQRSIYDYQWMLCVRGKAFYKDSHGTYELNKGSLLLIEPGIKHNFWFEDDKPCDIKWIHFDFEYEENVYDLERLISSDRRDLFSDELAEEQLIRKHYQVLNDLGFTRVIQVQNIHQINKYFEEIAKCYMVHKQTWQLVAKANWLLIMEQLISEQTKAEPLLNVNDKFAQVKEYIDLNYNLKISRHGLANYFGYNPDYFGKMFKEEMKKSLSTYINEVRLKKAINLLQNSEFSIDYISELVGFSDIYYFSKKMKSVTGQTPSQWRKGN